MYQLELILKKNEEEVQGLVKYCMEFLLYVYHILFIMKLSETCPNFDHTWMFAVTQTIRNMHMRKNTTPSALIPRDVRE